MPFVPSGKSSGGAKKASEFAVGQMTAKQNMNTPGTKTKYFHDQATEGGKNFAAGYRNAEASAGREYAPARKAALAKKLGK